MSQQLTETWIDWETRAERLREYIRKGRRALPIREVRTILDFEDWSQDCYRTAAHTKDEPDFLEMRSIRYITQITPDKRTIYGVYDILFRLGKYEKMNQFEKEFGYPIPQEFKARPSFYAVQQSRLGRKSAWPPSSPPPDTYAEKEKAVREAREAEERRQREERRKLKLGIARYMLENGRARWPESYVFDARRLAEDVPIPQKSRSHISSDVNEIYRILKKTAQKVKVYYKRSEAGLFLGWSVQVDRGVDIERILADIEKTIY